jgi:glycosyltransferase involved in cell wall biosynthesis
MRVLFLTKQQYMGKDLLCDRFGRFYEFPRMLAIHGHQVRGICLKYSDDGIAPPAERQQLDNVEWQSFQLGWNRPAAFLGHYQRLKKIAAEFTPDIVVGASDAMHVMLASSLSSRVDVPLAIDLYDDFESYRATRLPGIRMGLKRGILHASAISTVSSNLADKVTSEYWTAGVVRTISNAVCPEIFHPADKNFARQRLGLPESGLLIGTAGDLSVERGIKTLIQAFEKLSSKKNHLCLVLAGRLDKRVSIQTSGVRYLGELPHSDIGHLFNALDVGVIANRRNQFAEFCFPQKFYEMVACRLPMIAANVGVMRRMLAGCESCLYEPDSVDSLAHAIEKQLEQPKILEMSVPTWRDRGRDFQQLLTEALKVSRSSDSLNAAGR